MPGSDDKNETMLTYEGEGEVTIVQEFRADAGGGGAWGGGPISTGSGGDTLSDESSAHGGGPGGGSPRGPGQEIYTQPPDTPEQLALANRLARGEGTPAEALAYFQTHGYPQLYTLPSFDSTSGKWIFPQANIDVSSGDGHQVNDVIFATSGQSDASSSGDTSGPISSSWAGVSNGLAIPNEGGGAGRGEGDEGNGNDDMPSPDEARAAGPGVEIGDSSGAPDWTHTVGAEKGPNWLGEGPDPADGQFVPEPVEPDEDPYSRQDDDEIVPYRSEVVDDEVSDMFAYILNDQNPFLVRLILTQYAGLASIAVLVERYFANPLLAAPAQLVNAGKALRRAVVKGQAGDWLGAAEEEQVAAQNLGDAAIAIAAVIPVGGILATEASLGERLAGRGVRVTRWEYVNWREYEWARHQVWVTGSEWELRFQIEGEGAIGQVGVDGFYSSTGESIVANPGAHFAVETKMAGRIRYLIWGREAPTETEAYKAWYRAIQQLDRYLELSRRLGLSGVKYVVTEEAVIIEGVATRPVTTKWAEILRELYPNEFLEGFLEVLFKDPPPPEWLPD